MMDVLSDFGSLAVPILAFLGLIVLAGLVVWLGRRARRNRSHGLVAGHRLAVIDQVQIDEHRRLVLIQRDEVQHLVVLGGGSDFLVESGIGEAVAREARPAPATVRAVEPPRAPEAIRPSDHVPPPEAFRSPEPVREPPRGMREVPPPPPVTTSRPRPIPLPPEARAPVEPRPTTVSRGPARDIALEPAPIAPVPAAPFVTRRTTDFRAAEPDLPARPASPPPLAAHRAEPVVEPPAEPEPGARVTVKVDPLFADMADQLEEAMRRPANPEGEAARRAAPPAPPEPEQAIERALDRPAAPSPRGPEIRKAEEPRPAPAPQVPPANAQPTAAPVVSAPVVPAASAVPPAASAPAAAAPPVVATPFFVTTRPPARDPERPETRAPEPAPQPNRPELWPADIRPAEAPKRESRALDTFAPEIQPADNRAPEIIVDEPRPAASQAAAPAEAGDPFEEEMANLLGRSRRS